MTKNNKIKTKMLTDEDIKIIKSDPVSLADYVVESKVRSARKTMIIITIITAAVMFGAGTFVGMHITRESIPNNVVQIKIGEDTPVSTETEGKK